MDKRRLLKFKLKDNDVLVKYERPSDDAAVPDTVTLESGEAPRTELRQAMAAMAEHAIDICELPHDWDLKVIGISRTYGDFPGVVITALRDLDGSNAPMVINTPHFLEDSEDSDMNVYSIECGESLDELERLIFEYVDGARKQLVLECATAAN
jgi:hypothetical protein